MMSKPRLEEIITAYECRPKYASKQVSPGDLLLQVYAVNRDDDRIELGPFWAMTAMSDEELCQLLDEKIVGLLLAKLRRYRADLAESSAARGDNVVEFGDWERGDGA